jgi:hypothetical protein
LFVELIEAKDFAFDDGVVADLVDGVAGEGEDALEGVLEEDVFVDRFVVEVEAGLSKAKGVGGGHVGIISAIEEEGLAGR